MIFDHETNLRNGPIVTLANSQEKIYALTQAGTLHSVEGNKDHLSSQSCFMGSIIGKVKQIVFPANFSSVFACLSQFEITLIRVEDQRVLLQISLVENEYQHATSNCIEFMPDGKSIVTGWSDGKVRAFTPQKGKLIYIIKDAHLNKQFEGTPQ